MINRDDLAEDIRDQYDEASAENAMAEYEAAVTAGPEVVTGIEAFAEEAPAEDCYERSVCGAFLYFPQQMIEAWRLAVSGIDKPGSTIITREKHRAFIAVVLDLFKRNIPVDPLSIFKNTTLKQRDGFGGMKYACEHTHYYFALQNTRYHLGLLIDSYRRRRFQEITAGAADDVHGKNDLNAVIMELANQTKNLLRSDSTLITFTPDRMVDVLMNIAPDGSDASRETRQIPSSFRHYAAMAGDYVRGQIHLVGAPSGRGKTAHAFQEIQCALEHGYVCDVFALESDMEQYVQRYAMRNYRIHGRKMTQKSFNDADRKLLYDAAEYLTKFEGRMHMAPRGLYSAVDIAAMIQDRKNKTGQPCDMIVIDYLNRLKSTGKGSATEYASIHDNVEQIWALAAQENAVVILYSQLTMESIRESFKGGTKKMPGIGAFKGGAPTEAAKVCTILYADENEMTSGKQVLETQMIVCKANDGSQGVIPTILFPNYALLIEDTCQNDRVRYLKHFEGTGYNATQTRKELSR